MNQFVSIMTMVNGLILLANLAVLALVVKLYTEYFKDKSQSNRGSK